MDVIQFFGITTEYKFTSVLVVGCLDITAFICSAWPFVTTSATTPFSSSIPESLQIKNDDVHTV